jgi:hypothetical protein
MPTVFQEIRFWVFRFLLYKKIHFVSLQARNLLLQSGLPQNILAQVWGLSDVDADGRLSAEEFILAGHLCDIASKVILTFVALSLPMFHTSTYVVY